MTDSNPTTPTGGEPTEGAMSRAELKARMVGHFRDMEVTSLSLDYLAEAACATVDEYTSARVAELEGMLAVAREALKPFARLYELNVPLDPNRDHPDSAWAAKLMPVHFLRWGNFRRAAEALGDD